MSLEVMMEILDVLREPAEQCNRYGLCILSATMCVLHFNQNVPNHCKQVDEDFGWSGMVSRARRVMKDQNIVCC